MTFKEGEGKIIKSQVTVVNSSEHFKVLQKKGIYLTSTQGSETGPCHSGCFPTHIETYFQKQKIRMRVSVPKSKCLIFLLHMQFVCVENKIHTGFGICNQQNLNSESVQKVVQRFQCENPEKFALLNWHQLKQFILNIQQRFFPFPVS